MGCAASYVSNVANLSRTGEKSGINELFLDVLFRFCNPIVDRLGTVCGAGPQAIYRFHRLNVQPRWLNPERTHAANVTYFHRDFLYLVLFAEFAVEFLVKRGCKQWYARATSIMRRGFGCYLIVFFHDEFFVATIYLMPSGYRGVLVRRITGG